MQDRLFYDIADYVLNYRIEQTEAFSTARLCLLDSLGCGLLSLSYPACTKLLGPIVPGAEIPNGARIPGLSYQLDPVQAAFNIGTMIRWLDYNDTWLAAEWGHPSDNLGGILAVADYVSRQNIAKGKTPLSVCDVLTAMIKAYEIQGVIGLENSFNRVGLDHILLVRIATAAVVTPLLGGGRKQIVNALTNAWVDGGTLRCYRHSPNTGSRKSWAAGDATSRGVRLAIMSMTGEMGYPSALSAKNWGFYDVLYQGNFFVFNQTFASYVMENILFKISFPAEFHAQTAIEAALRLHESVKYRLNEIHRVEIQSQRAATRIIDKSGPLHNPADRDHCIQYMVAIGLIFGELTANHYEDKIAQDPRVDSLRKKIRVEENQQFSIDYLNPAKRSIANAIQVFFNDGTYTSKIQIEFPIGHRRRRKEGMPMLKNKLIENLKSRLTPKNQEAILGLFEDQYTLESTSVDRFMDLFAME